MSANMEFIRPGPEWRRRPLADRRAAASRILDCLQRILAAWREEKPSADAPLRELVSWVSLGQDLSEGIRIWRQEMHRAGRGAGRSPALKGHGRPAPSLPVGPGLASSQGVKTPYTQTSVPSSSETAE